MMAKSSTRASYNYPPGPDENVIWRGVQNRGPIDPTRYFTELRDKYGPAAHYKLGRHHIVYLNDPELIREVLVVQHANFIKERTQQRARNLLLGEGMITTDGTKHRQQRQVAQPAFHRQRIPQHASEIVERAVHLRDQLRDGDQRDLYVDMMHLSLDLVGRTLFNTDLGDEIRTLNKAVGNIMDVYNAIVLLPAINFLLKIPMTPLRKFVHARDRLDIIVRRMIDEHRLGQHGNNDLLSMMISAQDQMGWTDRDLRDQVVTVFLAGYETMAIALTWTWYLLSQNPEVEQKMHAEIDRVLDGRLPTYDDLPHLKYCEMVLAESMRLYPPAWAMGRQALQPFQLGPYSLPAKTTVVISQFVTHRDPRFFADPLRFDPERHTAEAKALRQRFSYFPFGMGPRQCIGEAFAWMEGVLVLATLAQKFRFKHVDGHKVVAQPLFTLRPKYGMKMIVEVR
jgi:cytochrome P450